MKKKLLYDLERGYNVAFIYFRNPTTGRHIAQEKIFHNSVFEFF